MSAKKCQAWLRKDRKRRQRPVACGDEPQPAGTERCGGSLEVTVDAVEEPTWGGTSARVEIIVECQKCGCTCHDPSPIPTRSGELGDFLTKLLGGEP